MYNILIVDDEKIERSGIRMLLKRMGIELGVFEACNGKQALEYLTSDKNTGMGHIDILLTQLYSQAITSLSMPSWQLN